MAMGRIIALLDVAPEAPVDYAHTGPAISAGSSSGTAPSMLRNTAGRRVRGGGGRDRRGIPPEFRRRARGLLDRRARTAKLRLDRPRPPQRRDRAAPFVLLADQPRAGTGPGELLVGECLDFRRPRRLWRDDTGDLQHPRRRAPHLHPRRRLPPRRTAHRDRLWPRCSSAKLGRSGCRAVKARAIPRIRRPQQRRRMPGARRRSVGPQYPPSRE